MLAGALNAAITTDTKVRARKRCWMERSCRPILRHHVRAQRPSALVHIAGDIADLPEDQPRHDSRNLPSAQPLGCLSQKSGQVQIEGGILPKTSRASTCTDLMVPHGASPVAKMLLAETPEPEVMGVLDDGVRGVGERIPRVSPAIAEFTVFGGDPKRSAHESSDRPEAIGRNGHVV
jgi:hypothetical protein